MVHPPQRIPTRARYQPCMEQTSKNLSASERLTLQYIADGEIHRRELDWVAIQRLKRMGFAEERGGSTMTTREGQRELGRMSLSNRPDV
jgi:hypothetical protein